MSAEQNLKVLQAYLGEHDESYLAEDAVFTDMSSGQRFVGRQAIADMIHWFYSVAFDASAEVSAVYATDEHGIFEGDVVGTHIGEFAGVPATNEKFRVPICVSYDFRDGQIAAGRVYFAVPALMQQIGAV
jgi:steroid delta-isomerase-like uncharacterized protein